MPQPRPAPGATIQDLQGQVQRLQQAGAAVPDLFAIPAAEVGPYLPRLAVGTKPVQASPPKGVTAGTGGGWVPIRAAPGSDLVDGVQTNNRQQVQQTIGPDGGSRQSFHVVEITSHREDATLYHVAFVSCYGWYSRVQIECDPFLFGTVDGGVK